MIRFLCTWRPFETRRLISRIHYPAQTPLLSAAPCELHADGLANVCGGSLAYTHMWKWYRGPAGCTCWKSWVMYLIVASCEEVLGQVWVQPPDSDLMPPLNQSPCPPLDSSPCDPSLPPQRTHEKQPRCLSPFLCLKAMSGPEWRRYKICASQFQGGCCFLWVCLICTCF